MPADPLQTFCDLNDGRIDAVIQTLGTYQPQAVNSAKIFQWLRQFDLNHYDLALRLLEGVEFYDLPRIHEMLRGLHRTVVRQFGRDGFSWNNVYFVPLGSPGESSHEMIRRYRDVNRVNPAKLKFVSDMQGLIYDASKKGARLAFIFVDDFIGSGKKVTDYWNDVLKQIVSLPPKPAIYVACCVACEQGIQKVRQTPVQVLAVHYVPDRLFLIQSNKFNAAEKQLIREYCNKAGNQPKEVYLEIMLAFAHGAPNNALSVLRGSKRQNPWRGILPRFDDLP